MLWSNIFFIFFLSVFDYSSANDSELLEFTQENVEKIFNSTDKYFAIAFLNVNSSTVDADLKLIQTVANVLHQKIRFTYALSKDEMFTTLVRFFDFSTQEYPLYAMFNPQLKKYIHLGGFNVEEITKFSNDVVSNLVKPSLKSQTLPDNWNDKVIKLVVSTTFHDFVNDNNAYSFMLFYAPNCGHCVRFHPVMEQIADLFKSNPKIKFGSVDATANEFEEIDIKGYPTIMIFRHGLTEKPYDFNCPRTVESIEKLINQLLEGANNDALTKFCDSEISSNGEDSHDPEHGHEHDHDHDHDSYSDDQQEESEYVDDSEYDDSTTSEQEL